MTENEVAVILRELRDMNTKVDTITSDVAVIKESLRYVKVDIHDLNIKVEAYRKESRDSDTNLRGDLVRQESEIRSNKKKSVTSVIMSSANQ